MSIMEIPDTLYRINRDIQIAQLIDRGLDLIAARAVADEIMQHSFIARGTALARECELDTEEFKEEMSLGGQTYKVPR